MLLDEVFQSPGGGAVAAGLVGERAPGRVDRVVEQFVVRVVPDHFDFFPPLGRGDGVFLGVGNPELAHGLAVLDLGIQLGEAKRLQRVHAAHVGVEVIFLPLVDGDRQAIGFLARQGAQEAFFGGHQGDWLRGFIQSLIPSGSAKKKYEREKFGSNWTPINRRGQGGAIGDDSPGKGMFGNMCWRVEPTDSPIFATHRANVSLASALDQAIPSFGVQRFPGSDWLCSFDPNGLTGRLRLVGSRQNVNCPVDLEDLQDKVESWCQDAI